MDIHAIKHLKMLAADRNPDSRARYEAICNQRDEVLTKAVIETARSLLKTSGYAAASQTDLSPDRKVVISSLETYLAESSIPETDQQLLGLLGMGVLEGYKIGQASEQSPMQFHQTDSPEVDQAIILRLGRALHRDPEQKALLWQHIHEVLSSASEHTKLIEASVEAVLDEIPVSDVDKAMAKVVTDSIMGG